MESFGPDGSPRPGGGTITAFEVPSGSGLRTDSYGYVGYRTNPRFDSLLAKVIARSASDRFEDAAAKATRALEELRVEGVPTNVDLFVAALSHPTVRAGEAHTRFVDEHMAELLAAVGNRREHLPSDAPSRANSLGGPSGPRLAA